jgi:hypothetical protein
MMPFVRQRSSVVSSALCSSLRTTASKRWLEHAWKHIVGHFLGFLNLVAVLGLYGSGKLAPMILVV